MPPSTPRPSDPFTWGRERFGNSATLSEHQTTDKEQKGEIQTENLNEILWTASDLKGSENCRQLLD